MKPIDIMTIGSAVRDVVFYSDAFSVIDNPEPDPTREQLLCVEFGAKIASDNVHFLYGGGAANTALNFAALGLHTGIATCVGDDIHGHSIIDHLSARNINTDVVTTSNNKATGFSFITVDEQSGDRTIYVHYGAANDLRVTKRSLAAAAPAWIYVASLHTSDWSAIIKKVQQTDATMAWNPGSTQLQAGYKALRPFLRRTQVLLLNRDEASELALSADPNARTDDMNALLEQLHQFGPEIVVITDGKNGAFVYDGTTTYTHPAPQDTPVDTTGAGDRYGSSFITGYIRYNGDIARAMELAQHTVNSLMQSVGAQSGVVRWSALPKKLRAA